jgi:hypothetical protein
MFGVSPAILTMLKQMNDYLQKAIKRAAVEKASDQVPDADEMAAWLNEQMTGWEPEIKGRKLADAQTRAAAARFLSGVAVNLIHGAAR